MNPAILASLSIALAPLSNDQLTVLLHGLSVEPLPARFEKFSPVLNEARAVAGALPVIDTVSVPAV